MTGSVQPSSSDHRLSLERRAFLDLLRMANTMANPKDIARQLAVLAQLLSGCEAVAVRLKSGPGYSYAANLGFSEHFVALEDELCTMDEDGRLVRDEHRKPVLACLCGRVLSGQVDRNQTFFTDRGSFVTASTSALLSSHLEPECLGPTRNRCNIAGYETVGLFPIRRDGLTYGLIQCNDPRPGLLTTEIVNLMENLATCSAHLFELAMT